jgi:hypothetical protein
MTDPRSTWRVALWPAVAGIIALAGCTHRIKVDPIKVEPIHLTLDIRLQVDRELDEFFDFEEDAVPVGETPAAPATGESS